MIRQFKTATSIVALLGAMLACPATAQAQADETATANDEIVVTAQRREEKSLDVPISVTAISPAALETANIQSLSDISVVTPGLRFDSQAAFVQPTIRGVGTAITTSGGGSNVGIYLDGFFSPNPLAADSELLNIKSIQVLKGPQGTLFGRNTTGGAILIQSADPGDIQGGRFKASYGRFNQVRVQGYAGGKLSDSIGLDLEAMYRRGDGTVRNILTNSTKDGQYENWTVRAGIKADLGENASVTLRYTHGEIDDPTMVMSNAYFDPVFGTGAANFAPPSVYTSTPGLYAGDVKRFFRSNNNIYQMTIKADLGFADLTSYSQHRTEKVDASNDLDQIGITIFQIGLPIDNSTWSQEFLLTSKPGSALQWTAGLFYMQNRDTYFTWVDNNVATAGRIRIGGSSTLTKTYAAFLDATYEISPSLFLTAGGRYSHDRIDDAYYIVAFTGVQTPVTAAQSAAVRKGKFTPRVVLRYKPSDSSSIYASYTKGYKAGILDVGGSTGNPVAPEDINAFELGYKYSAGGLSVDLAGFYYDYKNLQVSLFQGNPPSAQIINAASARIYGLEASLRYKVSDNFSVNAGMAWTHGRYTNFPNAPVYARCPTVAGCGGGTSFFVQSTNLRDVTMQRTPEFTGNVGASYTTDLGGGSLNLSGNLYYSSKFFFSPSGTQFPQKGYEVLSLRAAWTDPSDRFTLAAYGDNVTSSRYLTQVQYNNFGIGAIWSAPVTYGIELGVKF